MEKNGADDQDDDNAEERERTGKGGVGEEPWSFSLRQGLSEEL